MGEGVGVPEDTFISELQRLINRHSKENVSDTADFILAEYLSACLNTWDCFTRYRDSVNTMPNRPHTTSPSPRPVVVDETAPFVDDELSVGEG